MLQEKVIFEINVNPEFAVNFKKQGDLFLTYLKTQAEIAGLVPLVSYNFYDPKQVDKSSSAPTGKTTKEAVQEIYFYQTGSFWVIGPKGERGIL